VIVRGRRSPDGTVTGKISSMARTITPAAVPVIG
jgi:hypothetical protein